jgi:hypothetical protein
MVMGSVLWMEGVGLGHGMQQDQRSARSAREVAKSTLAKLIWRGRVKEATADALNSYSGFQSVK